MGSGRGYEHSHPWISFTVDLRQASVRVWSLLGQAVAGCRQIAEAALPPLDAAEMYRLYLSRGARASTAIEGNTLSEGQVRARLDGQLELPLSQEYLGREVDNILDACERIWQEIRGGQVPQLSPDLLADYNRRVLAGLEEHLDEGVVAGEIPRHRVAVAGYQGAPRGDCAYLLTRMCAWLEQEPATAAFAHAADNRIAGGLLQAILAHLYLAWIHPFGDGNGRTARLLEFMLLARSGVPAPTAHLLSNRAITTTRPAPSTTANSTVPVAPTPAAATPWSSCAMRCRASWTACASNALTSAIFNSPSPGSTWSTRRSTPNRRPAPMPGAGCWCSHSASRSIRNRSRTHPLEKHWYPSTHRISRKKRKHECVTLDEALASGTVGRFLRHPLRGIKERDLVTIQPGWPT